MLTIGQAIPDFHLPDQNEISHTKADLTGKWSIIYFYPKDDTPGCTTEACTIAEIYHNFQDLGVSVYGVSKDSPDSHKAFADKYSLPFTLLSDTNMEMTVACGAYKETTTEGNLVRSTQRMTYIINPEGTVTKVYPNVDPANHAVELLADIKTLIS